MLIPLPQKTAELIGAADAVSNPGLLLDKLGALYFADGVDSGKGRAESEKKVLQEFARQARSAPGAKHMEAVRASHERTLARLLKDRPGREWTAKTPGPLTLHLSRATAMENRGICLHPVHGFVYLPGSGLKGMARAWAETVWKPSLSADEQAVADETIAAVFGYSARGGSSRDTGASGQIVFHDAWPTATPRLYVDIATSHHGDYYAGKRDSAPADWEDPNPIPFLAIRKGAGFAFTLSVRRKGVDSRLLDLAEEWLKLALSELGAGAKTNAGYGRFEPAVEPPASPGLVTSGLMRIKLVTPAFISGSAQDDPGDCEMRSASLRGQLRWWWRAMHAGHVDVATLRMMEATVWGSAQSAGAVGMRLSELPGPAQQARHFSKQDVAREAKLPPSPNRKTCQGLAYGAYGMDDGKLRHYLPASGEWDVSLVARAGYWPSDAPPREAQRVDADLLLRQARMALRLLCCFGAIGSKERHGFGSLQLADDGGSSADLLREATETAGELRRELGVDGPYVSACLASPSLAEICGPVEIETPWTDPWFALDQASDCAQRFAQNYKHDRRKLGLGIPRKIGQPVKGEFHQSPQARHRYASPTHTHLASGEDGKLTVRLLAFPSPHLHDLETNRELLNEWMAFVSDELRNRCAQHEDEGQQPVRRKNPAASAPPSVFLEQGAMTDVELLKPKKKKGKLQWRGKAVATGEEGRIERAGSLQPNQAETVIKLRVKQTGPPPVFEVPE